MSPLPPWIKKKGIDGAHENTITLLESVLAPLTKTCESDFYVFS